MTLLKKKRKIVQYYKSGGLPESNSVYNKAFEEEPIDQLYRAIRRLNKADRAVILLYLDELPYHEIAEIIGTNPNNIGVRVKRIKDRLKKILDGNTY